VIVTMPSVQAAPAAVTGATAGRSPAAAPGSVGGDTFAALLETATAASPAAVDDGVTTLGEMVGTMSGGPLGLASAYLASASFSSLGAAAATPELRELIAAAGSQVGKPYVFGAEAALDDADPAAFDCSELTQWAAHQAGLYLPDGAAGQYRYCRESGTTMSVDEALRTPGALLFTFDGEPGATGGEPARAHVAISLGDGRTVEAKGRDHGVVVTDAADRFNFAARVPA
jgi:cell wall-associated NlpC family hydrolase